MSDFLPSSGRRPRHLLKVVAVMALASGGAFFWSNWHPASQPLPGDGVAIAAPKPGSPVSPPVSARPASKIERQRALKTISAQLKAFNSGNWAEAVKFQSDGLKGNFETPEAFGAMIQNVYPVFVHPKKVEFGEAMNFGGHIQIEVRLTGYDDHTVVALYSLNLEKGNYRVEGVSGGSAPRPVNDDTATV